ncbi:response regulator transcription factor [Aureibaculum sp. A20]|uniref:Response regulator transcription factor n=1 Tax=Aureibaculum flavum TaxID=2795986 RepID=A0ABS0WPX4_9FLAO|nr:LytTR family DNA-binding domain-containing protein [Aureibaculum flavum]MBJ2173974.1 response regulator transcription factor [Aureibaculum flavum]
MIKAIIVDDELSAIKSLQWEIETFCKGIEICESFTDPIEAISAINYIKPDCVFLDIEMPEMDGFQLLQNLTFRNFDLIITTAFDNYAIKAFKESAIDYLLKPIDSDDLIKSVSKIKVNKDKNVLGNELKMVLKNFMANANQSRIALPLAGKTLFVSPEDIFYCKADGNYCEIYFTNGAKEMLSKKIKEVETIINNNTFFRVHNSYLVNTNYIKEFVKSDGQYLVLENGITVPVSRSKKDELLGFLSH